MIHTTGWVAKGSSDTPATGAVTTSTLEAAPTMKDTVVVFVMARELSVPEIVAEETVVGAVSVAV